MMPTPEQEARLKMCKSSAEYDAEWQRITNENTKIMVDRAAAELRALREQEYDLWQTDRNISIQQTPPIKSTIVRSQNGHDAEYKMGIAHMRRTSPYRYQSAPRTQIQEADPILALITFSSIAVGCFALIVGAIKGCK